MAYHLINIINKYTIWKCELYLNKKIKKIVKSYWQPYIYIVRYASVQQTAETKYKTSAFSSVGRAVDS